MADHTLLRARLALHLELRLLPASSNPNSSGGGHSVRKVPCTLAVVSNLVLLMQSMWLSSHEAQRGPNSEFQRPADFSRAPALQPFEESVERMPDADGQAAPLMAFTGGSRKRVRGKLWPRSATTAAVAH